MEITTLVLGTRNQKKRLELEALLGPWGFRLLTLDEFPAAVEVEETGTTFAENGAKPDHTSSLRTASRCCASTPDNSTRIQVPCQSWRGSL